MPNTEFSTKTEILSDVWMDYRSEEEFSDFIEYNDLGLPLAYAISNKLVTPSETGKKLVEETFDLLLSGMDVEEDTGFDSLEHLLGS